MSTVATVRIPLDHTSLLARLIRAGTRRVFGAPLEPYVAQTHHPRVLLTTLLAETGVATWRSLPVDLRDLVVLAVAGQIGCTWCMDFGAYPSKAHSLDGGAKLQHLTAWRDSDVYSPTERRVLEYAEAMTATPPRVSDEMVRGLRTDRTDRQLIELTHLVCVENSRSRANVALGLTSQGFADTCSVPAR
jgi:alkylhydroperoxidase family enzyme